MLLGKFPYIHEQRDRGRPAEQDRLPRRQTGQFLEQPSDVVWDQTGHQGLIEIVYDAMEEEACPGIRVRPKVSPPPTGQRHD